LTVEAVDPLGASGTGSVTVVEDDPEPQRPIITLDGPFTVAEDAAVGTEVFTVEATDPDEGDEIATFDITGGNTDVDGDGEAAFAIDDDGVVTVQDADDLEADTNFNLEVVATDDSDQALESNPVTFGVEVTAAPDGNLTYDITGTGDLQASFDGTLALRYIFGFPGDDLTDGLNFDLLQDAERTSSDEILPFLQELDDAGALNVVTQEDQDPQASFDGTLILRQMLDFGVDDIAEGLNFDLLGDPQRTEPADIKSHLEDFSPA
jgi:hypothetical protein